LIKIIL